MPITKRKVVDQIVIEPESGVVLWRESTIIEEDGVELSRTYHRGSVMAGDTPPGHMPAEVEPFRAMADTPDARAKVEANKAKALAERGGRP